MILSPLICSKKVSGGTGGEDLYLLPAFVLDSFMPFHPIHPLIDTFLSRAFAESDPEEKRLRLGALTAIDDRHELMFSGHIILTRHHTFRTLLSSFRNMCDRHMQFGRQCSVVLLQTGDLLG